LPGSGHTILVKITTAGALGTMQYQLSLDGGAFGGNIKPAVPGAGLISTLDDLGGPSGNTKLYWPKNDQATGAALSLPPTATMTVTPDGTFPSTGWPTALAGNPFVSLTPGTGSHSFVVTIATPGVLGTMTFSYAVDGGTPIGPLPTTASTFAYT